MADNKYNTGDEKSTSVDSPSLPWYGKYLFFIVVGTIMTICWLAFGIAYSLSIYFKVSQLSWLTTATAFSASTGAIIFATLAALTFLLLLILVIYAVSAWKTEKTILKTILLTVSISAGLLLLVSIGITIASFLLGTTAASGLLGVLITLGAVTSTLVTAFAASANITVLAAGLLSALGVVIISMMLGFIIFKGLDAVRKKDEQIKKIQQKREKYIKISRQKKEDQKKKHANKSKKIKKHSNFPRELKNALNRFTMKKEDLINNIQKAEKAFTKKYDYKKTELENLNAFIQPPHKKSFTEEGLPLIIKGVKMMLEDYIMQLPNADNILPEENPPLPPHHPFIKYALYNGYPLSSAYQQKLNNEDLQNLAGKLLYEYLKTVNTDEIEEIYTSLCNLSIQQLEKYFVQFPIIDKLLLEEKNKSDNDEDKLKKEMQEELSKFLKKISNTYSQSKEDCFLVNDDFKYPVSDTQNKKEVGIVDAAFEKIAENLNATFNSKNPIKHIIYNLFSMNYHKKLKNVVDVFITLDIGNKEKYIIEDNIWLVVNPILNALKSIENNKQRQEVVDLIVQSAQKAGLDLKGSLKIKISDLPFIIKTLGKGKSENKRKSIANLLFTNLLKNNGSIICKNIKRQMDTLLSEEKKKSDEKKQKLRKEETNEKINIETDRSKSEELIPPTQVSNSNTMNSKSVKLKFGRMLINMNITPQKCRVGDAIDHAWHEIPGLSLLSLSSLGLKAGDGMALEDDDIIGPDDSNVLQNEEEVEIPYGSTLTIYFKD